MKEQLKELSETSAVRDIKDESYLASIGFVNYSSNILSKPNVFYSGEQGYVHENTQREIQRLMEEKKNEKILKKKMKREGI